jgi:DNA (cytosine-5)-methyltransferase 1
MTYNVIDVFCGAGGFSEGFRLAGGFRSALALDADPQACRTFAHNHPHTPVVCADVGTLADTALRGMVAGDKVDVVVGGLPCQGFSLAGKRLHDNPKNQLFREFVRILRLFSPPAFVFENVAGLLSMQNGAVFQTVWREFADVGYTLSWAVLDAANYGVPQHRRRLFLLGVRGDKRLLFPEPTHSPATQCSPTLFSPVPNPPFVTVREALGRLPLLEQGEGAEVICLGEEQWLNHRAVRHAPHVTQRYAAMPQGGNAESLPDELRTKKRNFVRLCEDAVPENLPKYP